MSRTMAIDYAQMRDCLLEAISDQVLSHDQPAELVMVCGAMKRRTHDAALLRGALDAKHAAFGPAETKLFDQALWDLFQEGMLAPLFRSQRYSGANGWEEGEFKLTARGLRGFQTNVAPTADLAGYLASLRQAGAGMASLPGVLAFADQAVRAARAELFLASAAMMGLALEMAVRELGGACASARTSGERPIEAPRADLPALVAWLEWALTVDPAAQQALGAVPELADGLAPIAACVAAIGPASNPDGRPTAAPTGPEVEAALVLLPGCIERTNALLRHFRAHAPVP